MSMLPLARKGDKTIGVCKIHGFRTGVIITGKSDVKVNHSIDSTIGDTVRASCGHTGVIITGNQTALDHMMPTARLSDRFVGVYSGIIVQGSPNTLA